MRAQKLFGAEPGSVPITEIILIGLVAVFLVLGAYRIVASQPKPAPSPSPTSSPAPSVSPSPSASASPTATPVPSAAAAPAKAQPTKSSVGPCGGTQALIENGNVVCNLDVTADKLPLEVRVLAPSGTPGISVTCTTEEACTTSYSISSKTYFSNQSFTNAPFSFNVEKTGSVSIKIPVTRHLEYAQNGYLGLATYTSSYWVYGPVQGARCCGTTPPLIYDIYNGYTESFKRY